MEQDSTKPAADAITGSLFDDWFDPIEMEVCTKVRGFIETMIEEELSAALRRPRYGRHAGSPAQDGKAGAVAGHRHGHRKRSLTGTFGRTEITVSRPSGWRSPQDGVEEPVVAGVSAPRPARAFASEHLA